MLHQRFMFELKVPLAQPDLKGGREHVFAHEYGRNVSLMAESHVQLPMPTGSAQSCWEKMKKNRWLLHAQKARSKRAARKLPTPSNDVSPQRFNITALLLCGLLAVKFYQKKTIFSLFFSFQNSLFECAVFFSAPFVCRANEFARPVSSDSFSLWSLLWKCHCSASI